MTAVFTWGNGREQWLVQDLVESQNTSMEGTSRCGDTGKIHEGKLDPVTQITDEDTE